MLVTTNNGGDFSNLLTNDLKGEFIVAKTNKALDANDYLIYNTVDKTLYYDADGSGIDNAPVALVGLNAAYVLNVADFIIV